MAKVTKTTAKRTEDRRFAEHAAEDDHQKAIIETERAHAVAGVRIEIRNRLAAQLAAAQTALDKAEQELADATRRRKEAYANLTSLDRRRSA